LSLRAKKRWWSKILQARNLSNRNHLGMLLRMLLKQLLGTPMKMKRRRKMIQAITRNRLVLLGRIRLKNLLLRKMSLERSVRRRVLKSALPQMVLANTLKPSQVLRDPRKLRN